MVGKEKGARGGGAGPVQTGGGTPLAPGEPREPGRGVGGVMRGLLGAEALLLFQPSAAKKDKGEIFAPRGEKFKINKNK